MAQAQREPSTQACNRLTLMNRRLILLVLALAGLALAAWWLKKRSTGSTLDPALSDFAIADTARVTRIHIADRTGKQVNLVRTEDGWMVNGVFKARQPEVNTVLKTFKRIEVKSPVPKSAEAMTLRTMAAYSTKVEIYTGGRTPEKVWIVGHATKDHFGTYMVLEKPGSGRSSSPFVMGMPAFTGVLNTRFPTNPDQWRSPEVFRYADLHALAEVEVQHTGRRDASYRILNTGDGPPQLASLDGAVLPMDTVLVMAALLPFKEFNYEDIVRTMAPARRDSLLSAPPNFTVTVKPRKGAAQDMKLWYMPYTGDGSAYDGAVPLHEPLRMWALVEDTLLVTVQRQYVDQMTQPAAAFRP